MSIVRYVNKNTGVVSLYESTSHYDPETKQSRPIRKYLGREDPVTGELIPSSGKRGRKTEKKQETSSDDLVTTLRSQLESMRRESEKKDKQIALLEEECRRLKETLQDIALSASAAMKPSRSR